MADYSFKRDVSVYYVFAGNKHKLDVSSINFSQELATDKLSDKSLQEPTNLFSKVIIDKALPASFDLSVYAIRENDFKPIFYRALDCIPFDLYVITEQDAFKIENCVITNTRFITDKNQIVALDYKGEAIKLTRVGDETYTVPGTLISPTGTKTYNRQRYIDITLGTKSFERLRENSIELQNNIKWLSDDVIVSCAEEDILYYPSEFIVEKKVLSGTFTTNRIENRDWGTEESLRIIAGEPVGATVYGFDFDIDSVTFTNREATGDVFAQSFDWRMTQNPSSLLEVIDYVTYPPPTAGAILDYLDQPILDYLNNAIIESP